jgi:SsrA-binding protein
MPVLAVNKRANFDYEIKEKFEAGIVLLGHEVKSVKTGHLNLKGSYVTLRLRSGQALRQAPSREAGRQGGPQKTKKSLPELYLINAHISLYKHAGNVTNFNPTRERKLLVKKKEIRHLIGKKQEQGLTLVPIKMYTKRSLIKLEFGIGRGKKKIDKREDIKKKDVMKKLRTLTKQKFSK